MVEVGHRATLMYGGLYQLYVRLIYRPAEIWLVVDECLENACVQFRSDKLDSYRFR